MASRTVTLAVSAVILAPAIFPGHIVHVFSGGHTGVTGAGRTVTITTNQ